MICDVCGQEGAIIRHVTRSYGKKTNLLRNGDEITSPSRRIDLGQICSILNHKS